MVGLWFILSAITFFFFDFFISVPFRRSCIPISSDWMNGLPYLTLLLSLFAILSFFSFFFPLILGIPVKWTNNGFIKPGTPNSTNPIPPAIIHNTALLSDLTEKAKVTAKKLLGEGPGLENGELNLLRLHTRTNELIIAPAGDCTLAVVQKNHSAAMVPLVQLAEQQQLAQMAEEKKGGGDKK
jgi:hypothetical protein